MELTEVRLVAEELVRRVGARIRESLESSEALQITHKGITDLVTEIDIWSEQQITEGVAARFPDHRVVGEETSLEFSRSSGKSLRELIEEGITWVVDPLDGTSNFSNHIPYCAVSIAVLFHGVCQLGVVYDPARNELFTAQRGQGSELNGKRIRVSDKSKPIEALVASAFANDRFDKWDRYAPTLSDLILSCRNVRSFGAAALDLCWVACGRFDGFFEFNLKPWDIAAAALIVEEAGGKGESFGHGGPPGFSLFGTSFLFSGATLFPSLREVVTRTVS